MNFPDLPQEELSGLLRLAQMSPAQFAQLKSSLSSVGVVIDRDSFAESVHAVPGTKHDDLKLIIWSLMYLHSYLVAGEIETHKLVDDVCATLEQDQAFSPKSVKKLRESLPALLDLDNLRLRAKAVDLQVDHARAFQSVRIITDVRPVFCTRSPQEVKGLLTFHSLKIEYFQDTGTNEIFIALDDRDLAELRYAIERAEIKGKTLRNLFRQRLGLPDFANPREQD